MKENKTISVKIKDFTVWLTPGEVDEYRREAKRLNEIVKKNNKKELERYDREAKKHTRINGGWRKDDKCSCGATLHGFGLCPNHPELSIKPPVETKHVIEAALLLRENVDVDISPSDSINIKRWHGKD